MTSDDKNVLIEHQEGCRPSEDAREACQCDAVVREGDRAVVRPAGVGGATIAEVRVGHRVRP